MTVLDYFAWFVLIAILFTALLAFVALAQLPGRIASARNHPQADAINVAGWLGLLLTLGIVWVAAMIWANIVPSDRSVGGGSDGDTDALTTRVAALESKLESLRGGVQ